MTDRGSGASEEAERAGSSPTRSGGWGSGGEAPGNHAAGASKAIAQLLVAGIALGCALIAGGALLCAFDGGLHPGIGLGATGFAVHGLYTFDGTALLRAGILVLILTPIVRVVAVAALFAQRNEAAGVVWAIVVLLLLTLTTVLELRH